MLETIVMVQEDLRGEEVDVENLSLSSTKRLSALK